MSRTTQFIGLNEAATRYVKNLKSLESDLSTSGMFDEKIPLQRWVMPDDAHTGKGERTLSGDDGQLQPCIREVVQTVPWSSGPMIFTCLAFDYGNTLNSLNSNAVTDDRFIPNYSNKAFEWVTDPSIGKNVEYDQVTGRMWV